MSEIETVHQGANLVSEPPGAIELDVLKPSGAVAAASITSDTPPDDTQYPPNSTVSVVFLAVSLVLVLAALDGNIIATAVPSITDHFHTVADVGWYYTAYRLASSSLQFAFGKMYTIFPTKPLILASTAIFLCGSVLCAAATSSIMFVVGRAVTGVGLAGAAAGFFTIMVAILPLSRRPLLSAVFGLVEGVSNVAAPPIGGVIVQTLSWRWCFWINLPVGGAAILAMIFFLPETSKNRPKLTGREIIRKLDLTGTLVFIPSLTALFIAFNWGGIVYAWNNPKMIALYVVFAFLLGIFMVDQVVKGDDAILPVRVMKDRNVLAGALFITAISGALSIQEYYSPTFFQAVLGYSPARSGYMILPCLIGTIIGFMSAGGGTSYFGYYTPFMFATAILLPIGSGLLTMWSPSTTIPFFVGSFFLVGIACGLGFGAPQTSIQTTLPKADVQLGIAVMLFFQNFGPALFVAIAQAIFTNRLSANLQTLAPGSNVTRIETLGLTEIKHQFTGVKLQEVTRAFSESIQQTFYLALGLSCIAIIGAAFTNWASVKKKED